MKTFPCSLLTIILAVSSIGGLPALDLHSGVFIDYLLGLKGPGAPAVFEDAVVFTVSSDYASAGVAFANENFETIHWFQRLLVPIDQTQTYDPKNKIPPEMMRDSGIAFYAYTLPPQSRVKELKYRFIINGLWTTDPRNPTRRYDDRVGADVSVTRAPPSAPSGARAHHVAGALNIAFDGEPGERVYVAGDFNNWDPFMYQMREVSPGAYRIAIPLPAGTYRYTIIYKGQRTGDLDNNRKIFTADGDFVNIVTIQ